MASHIISKSSSGVAHKRPLNSDGAFQRRCGSDSSTSEAAMTYVSKVSNEGEDSTTTTKASSPPPKKIKVSIGLTAPPTMVLQTPPPRKIPRSVVTPTDNLVLTGLELQKISPSVAGIQEVSRHLRRRSPSPRPNSKTHTLLALPTECSYEICALIDWKKDEESSSSPTSKEFENFRTERLTQGKPAQYLEFNKAASDLSLVHETKTNPFRLVLSQCLFQSKWLPLLLFMYIYRITISGRLTKCSTFRKKLLH